MTQTTRIFINGFGRIGRTVFRQIMAGPGDDRFEIVGINDIAPFETCVYLLRYDSVYGPFPGQINAGDRAITVAGSQIPVTQTADLRKLDLSHVDIVLECTGKAQTRSISEAGIEAGAANVLVSGPSPAVDATIVLGANDEALGGEHIVSNASCTTNAIAPLLRTLDQGPGIERAHVTTVHCYTGSQPTVDKPGPSFERSRAAAVSMVPTTTSAADQVTQVLPGFRNRLSVSAVRVPCISVSAIDAVIQLAQPPKRSFAGYLRAAFAGSAIVGLIDDPCVSTDLRARPESLVIALPETMEVGGQVRLLGWYDNEWAYSARMLDLAQRLATRSD
jgi:glyceraldehyde 3-phosphate dehydrogenase